MCADELIPQRHGGALRRDKRNKGGPGRARSPVCRARELGPAEALALLSAIADGYPVVRMVIGGRPRIRWTSATVGERIKAILAMAELGGLLPGGGEARHRVSDGPAAEVSLVDVEEKGRVRPNPTRGTA